MRITVETFVESGLDQVWKAWNTPADIQQWNAASDDWHTSRATVDLREGGKFTARMEARDGSVGFDFEATYTRILPGKRIEYQMGDGREVTVDFLEQPGGVLVRETFDAESENPADMQRAGWQAILDSFGRYVASRR